ncbi:MAG: nucleoside phosphorylase [Bacteroidales bacterium]
MAYHEPSELIINPDGSAFHLGLKPEQVGDTVILVGDPMRVNLVGKQLREVEFLASNREFVSIAGFYENQRINVMSSGIGTDNIDIVLNELDALVNIDFKTRLDKPGHRSLKIIRIGTSGSIHPSVGVGAWLASAWSIGLDGLMDYYLRPVDEERDGLVELLRSHPDWPGFIPLPYASRPDGELLSQFASTCITGITISAHGFYGPQARTVRARPSFAGMPDFFSRLNYQGYPVTNIEMESSALYGLSEVLGHRAMTVCLIIANRLTKKFHPDYKPDMEKLISHVLHTVTDPNC